MSDQGTHFWHMSFLAHNAIGLTAQERSGHWTPTPGVTRMDAMNELRRQVNEASPYLTNAVMLSFDIQLNQLP
ncbi:hypothetical protein [Streptomyces sp. W4I9-2]|uniref:hypothetical protein n=1 Tax=Streptomyces sp. W4I9-2 TaxID=3042297 RepID=UPI00278918FD|nr:hypothetical protein [Streptomyces sp. W4I9-2]MDQ0694229.1 hypothetical protein [Streptomyces sp. W4I9-2]